MTTVPYPSDLPAGSQAFARGVISSLEAIEQSLRVSTSDQVATNKGLAASLQSLSEQIMTLSSRISVTASGATFNTGSLPNDSTWHSYGSGFPVVVDVPTGKLNVTVGCGQATISSAGGGVTAEATFSISGGIAEVGDNQSRAYFYNTSLSGVPLAVTRAFEVTPGTYTITGQMRAWASGTSSGSVQFIDPYITVQVTG